MRVYLDPPETFSRAMQRVGRALRQTRPRWVEPLSAPVGAEHQVLHVIGYNNERHAPEYSVIQYCLLTTGTDLSAWHELWQGSRLVWSYYDIEHLLPPGVRFYHAPLGVDGEVFKGDGAPRYMGVVTSGYVAGPGAEAIEEVADAALEIGLSVFHVGPHPVGMSPRREATWRCGHGMSDEDLAGIYGRARWVSGLRHVEGFELPVLEGLACGARPIVFDRPDMRQWYDDFAEFVPDCSGTKLVDALVRVMSEAPRPVTAAERAEVLRRFNWDTITRGFWEAFA